jgi:hypothetical protein
MKYGNTGKCQNRRVLYTSTQENITEKEEAFAQPRKKGKRNVGKKKGFIF